MQPPLTDEELENLNKDDLVWMVTKPQPYVDNSDSKNNFPKITKLKVDKLSEDLSGRPMVNGRGATWRWFFKNYWDAYAWWVKYAKASEEN